MQLWVPGAETCTAVSDEWSAIVSRDENYCAGHASTVMPEHFPMDREGTLMNADKTRRSGIAEIDYSRDTLFGPIPMQATCRVRLATIEHDGHGLRELTIIGDVPEYLPKSAIIRIAMDGRIEAGPVREHYSVQDNGEEQFKLLFENEHRRRMH